MDQDQQRDPADEAANRAEWQAGDGPTGNPDRDLADAAIAGARVPTFTGSGDWIRPLPTLPSHDQLLCNAVSVLRHRIEGVPPEAAAMLAGAWVAIARELRESQTLTHVPDHVHDLSTTGGPLPVPDVNEGDNSVLGRTREVPLITVPWRQDDLRNAQRSRAPRKCALCHTLVQWDQMHEGFRHLDPEAAARTVGLHDVVTTT